MFTTTNVAATGASTGGVGPVAAAVPPTFQIIGASVSGSSVSSASSSSSSSASSSVMAPGTWRISPISSSFIKQPTVVSIINGNMSLSSSSPSVPFNSTGLTIPGNSSMICISTTNQHQYHPISAGNLLLQSSPTVRLVSTPLHSSSSTPTLTLLNNSNVTVNSNPRPTINAPGRRRWPASISTSIPLLVSSLSSSSIHFKPGICIDTPVLGRLAPITIQRQSQFLINVESPCTWLFLCCSSSKSIDSATLSSSDPSNSRCRTGRARRSVNAKTIVGLCGFYLDGFQRSRCRQ